MTALDNLIVAVLETGTPEAARCPRCRRAFDSRHHRVLCKGTALLSAGERCKVKRRLAGQVYRCQHVNRLETRGRPHQVHKFSARIDGALVEVTWR